MALIRVSIDVLRKNAKKLDEVVQRANAIISSLNAASVKASLAEDDFGSRVKQREALAVSFIQRIINDATSASEYLKEKANAFEQADLASQMGLQGIAEQIRALADLEVSFPLMPPWLWNGKCPPGFNAEIWRRLPLEDREEILSDPIHQWDKWIRQKIASGEIDYATLEEFEDLLAGVRKVWAWDSLSVRVAPGIEAERLGYLSAGQIVNWTGQVKSVDGDEWYEVIYRDRYGREVRGWSWTGRLEQYVYVNPEIDPNRGGSHPFDMSEPTAYIPQDGEIDSAARTTKFPQKLILDDFLLEHRIVPRREDNDNLCGEFASAAVLEEDVLDVLDSWLRADDKKIRNLAADILVNDRPTTRAELQTIFTLYGRGTENHDDWMSPSTFQNELREGSQFMALVGIDPATGRLVAGGKGHWALIEEVAPAGNSGWVRVMQSHIIQTGEEPPWIFEEVYTFDEFQASWGNPGEGNSSRFSGFWVEPAEIIEDANPHVVPEGIQ